MHEKKVSNYVFVPRYQKFKSRNRNSPNESFYVYSKVSPSSAIYKTYFSVWSTKWHIFFLNSINWPHNITVLYFQISMIVIPIPVWMGANALMVTTSTLATVQKATVARIALKVCFIILIVSKVAFNAFKRSVPIICIQF